MILIFKRSQKRIAASSKMPMTAHAAIPNRRILSPDGNCDGAGTGIGGVSRASPRRDGADDIRDGGRQAIRRVARRPSTEA
jgi:hypothetical protein